MRGSLLMDTSPHPLKAIARPYPQRINSIQLTVAKHFTNPKDHFYKALSLAARSPTCSNPLNLPWIRATQPHHLRAEIKRRDHIHQKRRAQHHWRLRRAAGSHDRRATHTISIARNQRPRIVPERMIPNCDAEIWVATIRRDVAGHGAVVGIGLRIPQLVERVGDRVGEDVG